MEEKFTETPSSVKDGEYLSKAQLAEKLGSTILVDNRWKQIAQERKNNKQNISVLNGRNDEFFYTSNDYIRYCITAGDEELKYFSELLASLLSDEAYEKLVEEAIIRIMKIYRDVNGLKCSDGVITAIVTNKFVDSTKSDNDLEIIRVHKLLRKCLDSDCIESNREYLEYCFAKLNPDSGNTNYRSSDFDKKAFNAQYTGTVPPYARHDTIEDLMDGLFVFLDNETSPFIRLITTLYHVQYIKPFDKYNKQMAMFLGYATCWKSFGPGSLLLPLGLLVDDRNDSIENAYQFTFTSNDLSYIFDASSRILRNSFPKCLGELDERKIGLKKEYEIKHSMYDNKPAEKIIIEDEEIAPVEKPIVIETVETTRSFEEPHEIVKEDKEVEIDRQPEESFEQEVVENTHISEQIVQTKEPQSVVSEVTEREHISETITEVPTKKEKVVYKKVVIPFIPKKTSLSKERIKEYTQYLLERYPTLNKKQASYVANHMEPGLYYDINSFKKFNKCAYETARTSMDKLAEMSFYKKLQVKNKYVYTPIIGENQGDK